MTLNEEPNFQNISQIKAANKAAGYYFFERDTMRFFASRIEGRAVYGGRYFVTSEQFKADGFPGLIDGPRKYTLREASADGNVGTFGKFQGFDTLEDARTMAKSCARLLREAGATRTCDSCGASVQVSKGQLATHRDARNGRRNCDASGTGLYTPTIY